MDNKPELALLLEFYYLFSQRNGHFRGFIHLFSPPVVGAQHFLPPWLLTSAGDRIATTASKPRHDRKRRLFRQLTSVIHATLGYSRLGSSDSMPYTLFFNEGLEPEFLFLSVAISLKNCGKRH